MFEDSEKKFIIAVDIGTTNIRCYIYDEKTNILGKVQEKIILLHPEESMVELDPDYLWHIFQKVIRDGLIAAKLDASKVSCLGISTQRSSFITWNRITGMPFHNFITWKDKRAEKLCEEWNNSMKIKTSCGCLGTLEAGTLVENHWPKQRTHVYLYFTGSKIGSKRYQAASILKLTSAMVLMRLVWVLQHFGIVREKTLENEALFGTIDTWLLWKLTAGQVHATEGSNACVTGIFDPFQMCWATWAINMFQIPVGLLPEIKNTSDTFGETEPSLFGAPIAITALVGDQQSSMFGECCFDAGDLNCTLGTGSFIDINTGRVPHCSYKGVYPIVGWTINSETTYIAECGTYDTGSIILWAKSIGLFEEPNESSDIALSVSDNGGIYFVPAFNGLLVGQHDVSATAALIGLNMKTTKAHIARAVLEALAFQVQELYEVITEEVKCGVTMFKINGGVSSNDFIVQLIADLTVQQISRSKQRDSSSLGAAFLAGLASGVWKNKGELQNLQKNTEHFVPTENVTEYYKEILHQWKRAVSRCINWYKN